MPTANISRNTFVHLCTMLLSMFCLILLAMLSACSGDPTSHANTSASATTASGDTPYIPVNAKPEIIVKGENVVQLTLVGSDTQSISTTQYALPYHKNGNQVTIDFGKTVIEPLAIKIPREATLSVIISSGNVVIDTIQGQVSATMNSGTIQVKNFTPDGANTIITKNGTITVAFTDKTSCSVHAQTNFGAIVSSYATISQKRSNMSDQASGTIGSGSQVTVNLSVGYGSITIGGSSQK